MIIDEADGMTAAGQLRMLHILDDLKFAVIIFTSNEDLGSFESRFLSRVKCLHFSTQGLAEPASTWLQNIARSEGHSLTTSEAERRIRQARNNLRMALNTFEVEVDSLSMAA